MTERRTSKKLRARDWGITIGRLAPGPLNAITDVAGVRVGHRTLKSEDGRVRTGVTAILPNDDPFMKRVAGGGYILNGAGELSGFAQVQEWGIIETPILLTNTLSVGTVSDACIQWLVDRHPGIGTHSDVPIPLVGECDDSWLNDIAGRHVKAHHVLQALERAQKAEGRSAPVAEGAVGGGTGMVSFDFKSGIGTASRRLPESHGGYLLGVLVQSNVGRMADLRVDGVPVGDHLDDQFAQDTRRREAYGSIIVVFATDAPLLPRQLSHVARRCALGLGRVGSLACHGSGEIIVGFSTANATPRQIDGLTGQLTFLYGRHTEPLYRAAIEATEEAVLNSMFAAGEMLGFQGHRALGLPNEQVSKLWAQARR